MAIDEQLIMRLDELCGFLCVVSQIGSACRSSGSVRVYSDTSVRAVKLGGRMSAACYILI